MTYDTLMCIKYIVEGVEHHKRNHTTPRNYSDMHPTAAGGTLIYPFQNYHAPLL